MEWEDEDEVVEDLEEENMVKVEMIDKHNWGGGTVGGGR